MENFNKLNTSDETLKAGSILMKHFFISNLIENKGYKRVYKGINNRNNKEIIIKELLLDKFIVPDLKEQVLEQFQIEVKIFLNLLHTNLPRFEDYFICQDRRYLVMEYIDGNNIEEIVSKNNGFLAPEQIVAWALELCDVLEYLHTRKPSPIIYKSLCPQNVLLGKDGKLKLIDFGIAKLFDPKGLTLPVAKTANKHYSPLEQIVARTDERSDIFSLGTTLYFILTKEHPMPAAERALTETPLPSCRKFNQQIPAFFDQILSKSTEVSPDDRYQNISDMKADLKRLNRAITMAGITKKMKQPDL